MCDDVIYFAGCLKAYAVRNNGELPERIFMYRDGVGEGQLPALVTHELTGFKVGKCLGRFVSNTLS